MTQKSVSRAACMSILHTNLKSMCVFTHSHLWLFPGLIHNPKDPTKLLQIEIQHCQSTEGDLKLNDLKSNSFNYKKHMN